MTVHDLGKLLLAFTMLWGYVNFSQFLIIWSGNVSEETPFYLRRLQGGWQVVAIVLLVFHFALPFALLLSRPLKRNARALAGVAALMLRDAARRPLLADRRPTSSATGTTDAAAAGPLDGPRRRRSGIGGLWLFLFARQARTAPRAAGGRARGARAARRRPGRRRTEAMSRIRRRRTREPPGPGRRLRDDATPTPAPRTAPASTSSARCS